MASDSGRRSSLDERLFKCCVCNAKFWIKSKLIKHYESHSVEENRCSVCGSIFQDDRELGKHYLTHQLIKPFSCLSCESSFFTEKEFLQHSAVMHPEIRQVSKPLKTTKTSLKTSTVPKLPLTKAGLVLSNAQVTPGVLKSVEVSKEMPTPKEKSSSGLPSQLIQATKSILKTAKRPMEKKRPVIWKEPVVSEQFLIGNSPDLKRKAVSPIESSPSKKQRADLISYSRSLPCVERKLNFTVSKCTLKKNLQRRKASNKVTKLMKNITTENPEEQNKTIIETRRALLKGGLKDAGIPLKKPIKIIKIVTKSKSASPSDKGAENNHVGKLVFSELNQVISVQESPTLSPKVKIDTKNTIKGNLPKSGEKSNLANVPLKKIVVKKLPLPINFKDCILSGQPQLKFENFSARSTPPLIISNKELTTKGISTLFLKKGDSFEEVPTVSLKTYSRTQKASSSIFKENDTSVISSVKKDLIKTPTKINDDVEPAVIDKYVPSCEQSEVKDVIKKGSQGKASSRQNDLIKTSIAVKKLIQSNKSLKAEKNANLLSKSDAKKVLKKKKVVKVSEIKQIKSPESLEQCNVTNKRPSRHKTTPQVPNEIVTAAKKEKLSNLLSNNLGCKSECNMNTNDVQSSKKDQPQEPVIEKNLHLVVNNPSCEEKISVKQVQDNARSLGMREKPLRQPRQKGEVKKRYKAADKRKKDGYTSLNILLPYLNLERIPDGLYKLCILKGFVTQQDMKKSRVTTPIVKRNNKESLFISDNRISDSESVPKSIKKVNETTVKLIGRKKKGGDVMLKGSIENIAKKLMTKTSEQSESLVNVNITDLAAENKLEGSFMTENKAIRKGDKVIAEKKDVISKKKIGKETVKVNKKESVQKVNNDKRSSNIKKSQLQSSKGCNDSVKTVPIEGMKPTRSLRTRKVKEIRPADVDPEILNEKKSEVTLVPKPNIEGVVENAKTHDELPKQSNDGNLAPKVLSTPQKMIQVVKISAEMMKKLQESVKKTSPTAPVPTQINIVISPEVLSKFQTVVHKKEVTEPKTNIANTPEGKTVLAQSATSNLSLAIKTDVSKKLKVQEKLAKNNKVEKTTKKARFKNEDKQKVKNNEQLLLKLIDKHQNHLRHIEEDLRNVQHLTPVTGMQLIEKVNNIKNKQCSKAIKELLVEIFEIDKTKDKKDSNMSSKVSKDSLDNKKALVGFVNLTTPKRNLKRKLSTKEGSLTKNKKPKAIQREIKRMKNVQKSSQPIFISHGFNIKSWPNRNVVSYSRLDTIERQSTQTKKKVSRAPVTPLKFDTIERQSAQTKKISKTPVTLLKLDPIERQSAQTRKKVSRAPVTLLKLDTIERQSTQTKTISKASVTLLKPDTIERQSPQTRKKVSRAPVKLLKLDTIERQSTQTKKISRASMTLLKPDTIKKQSAQTKKRVSRAPIVQRQLKHVLNDPFTDLSIITSEKFIIECPCHKPYCGGFCPENTFA